MTQTLSGNSLSGALEQLLLREDTWIGHSRRFAARAAIATGYAELDVDLMNRGWPLGSLVEVCQPEAMAEWRLFAPALRNFPGVIVLLNPPAVPFCQALIQEGIELDRLLVVSTKSKAHFVACFIELVRTSVSAVLAWQPKESLTYTELRKCQLAAADSQGLGVIFRPAAVQQRNSPAVLRLFTRMVSHGLEVTVFKQKGFLQKQQARPIVIALPETWQPALPYCSLTRHSALHKPEKKSGRIARIIPLRGKS